MRGLQSVRRQLMPELMRMAYRRAVLEYIGEWRQADRRIRRSYPNTADFSQLISSAGVPAPTLPNAAAYLRACLRRGECPKAEDLMDRLVAGIPLPRTQ